MQTYTQWTRPNGHYYAIREQIGLLVCQYTLQNAHIFDLNRFEACPICGFEPPKAMVDKCKDMFIADFPNAKIKVNFYQAGDVSNPESITTTTEDIPPGLLNEALCSIGFPRKAEGPEQFKIGDQVEMVRSPHQLGDDHQCMGMKGEITHIKEERLGNLRSYTYLIKWEEGPPSFVLIGFVSLATDVLKLISRKEQEPAWGIERFEVGKCYERDPNNPHVIWTAMNGQIGQCTELLSSQYGAPVAKFEGSGIMLFHNSGEWLQHFREVPAPTPERQLKVGQEMYANHNSELGFHYSPEPACEGQRASGVISKPRTTHNVFSTVDYEAPEKDDVKAVREEMAQVLADIQPSYKTWMQDGADGEPTQLDRIEAKLDQIIKKLSASTEMGRPDAA